MMLGCASKDDQQSSPPLPDSHLSGAPGDEVPEQPSIEVRKEGEKPAAGSTPKEGRVYPEQLRNAYLESCNKGAEAMGKERATAYCGCTVAGFESRFSVDEFVDMASRMDKGDIPSEMMSVIKSCTGLLTAETTGPKAKGSGTKLKDAGQFRSGFVTGFKRSCVDGAKKGFGEARAKLVCACALEEIEKAYTVDELLDVARQIEKGGMPPKIMEIMTKCVQKVGVR